MHDLLSSHRLALSVLQDPLPLQTRQDPLQTCELGWYEQVPKLQPVTQFASPHLLALSVLQDPLPLQTRHDPLQTWELGWYEQLPELQPVTQLASPHLPGSSVLQEPLPLQTRQSPLQSVPDALFVSLHVLPSAAQTPLVLQGLLVVQGVPAGQDCGGVGVGVGVAGVGVPPPPVGAGVGVPPPPPPGGVALAVNRASRGVAVSAFLAS